MIFDLNIIRVIFENVKLQYKEFYLQAITMIDPANSWIEFCSVPEARVDVVANQVELAWLTRYPRPNKITVDRDKEILTERKL